MPDDYGRELEAEQKEAEERAAKQREIKAKRKKILAAGVFTVGGAFVVLVAILLIFTALDEFSKNRAKAEIERNPRRYNYVDPDYALDIFEDEGYLAKDRNIWFADGILKTVITDDNRSNYTPEAQFMYDVINTIIKGDYMAYNKIFTEDYKKNAGDDLRERFTMQQLFEIEFECVGYREEGKVKYTDMMVIYRIRNNNGTFRNDLDYNDEGYIPVVYMLVTDAEGSIKVHNLMTRLKYSSGLYD